MFIMHHFHMQISKFLF